MSALFAVLVFCIIGTLRARHPDIDINRIKLIPREEYHRPSNFHSRRSIITSHLGQNDYDNYSSRILKLQPSMHVLHNAPSLTKAKTGKFHQPREDPRLFYQSDSYIKEVNRKNLNNEVSSIYLGRGVVRVNDNDFKSLPIRLRDNEINNMNEDRCVRCPRDRTLITKAGVDRAALQHPRILTCSGKKANRGVRFNRVYGPEFGTLLKEGSHIVIGRITYKGQILQACRMQINVLLQSCSVPEYLVSQCNQNNTCTFTCRDTKAELRGPKMLTCNKDLLWSGRLPVCSARTWCTPPPPPEHGNLSCKGVTLPNGSGLAEGSSCRVKCTKGWRRSPRAVCRRGLWTHELSCQPKRS